MPVAGNAYAIADAIRNLVENAVVHAPARSEVTVAARPEGAGSSSPGEAGQIGAGGAIATPRSMSPAGTT